MNESAPTPHESRWMVWTDHRSESLAARDPRSSAKWSWAASGPRGHMSGAEGSAHDAEQRAWAAFQSLMGYHELNPPKSKDAS